MDSSDAARGRVAPDAVGTPPVPRWHGQLWRDRRVHPAVGVLLPSLPLLAIQVFGTLGAARWSSHHAVVAHSVNGWAILLVVVGPVALSVRQWWPHATLVAVGAATLCYYCMGYANGPVCLSLVVALFYAVIRGSHWFAWLCAAVGYTGFALAVVAGPIAGEWRTTHLAVLSGAAAMMVIVLTAAELVRVAMERARVARQGRWEQQRRQAGEERLRIARDLHDVLAHNISLINVQAGVALHLLDDHPEQTRPALTAIKQASKEALGELRSVLEVLRQNGEGAPRSPTATLERLPDLIEQTRATGLAIRFETSGEPRSVSHAVGVAAYRITQEALTNVVRHSSADVVRVVLAYGDHDLTVSVRDNGTPSAAPGERASRSGDGTGIIGMRERATALGGTLRAGQASSGTGFVVVATLPLSGPGDQTNHATSIMGDQR